MEQESSVLMSAQIHFIDARFSLVHIPLDQYQSYLQPILRLIFPAEPQHGGADDPSHVPGLGSSWANRYPFLNISVTPIECSIVCLKTLAEELFRTIGPSPTTSNGATIFSEDLVVMSVEGEGLEAGKRVLELTSPLALAGISIFFITTYFSDYIIVPAKSQSQVIRALEDRGFHLEANTEAYVNPAARHHRNRSSTSSVGHLSPSTPPPATVSELQTRTFALLKRHAIVPRVDPDIRLVHCAGHREDANSPSRGEVGLHLGLTKSLLYQPRFLSLTLTGNEAPSMLLDRRLISNFETENVLLGNMEDSLVPIMLDLEPLPLEATGIVCGVAGKLVGDNSDGIITDSIEMLYLSTARAGTVIVETKDLDHAMRALQMRDDNEDQI
ncbi:MAG: hypothetical protein L6R40_003771 [Gallowayella cf. fulva]|nr:MAG: hypothetical protein L6R40_003771 [Xanthomendoza cf. fulva]